MLPLSLLRCGIGSPMLIELKTGETYNGILAQCDTWMNVQLTGVVHTSPDGTKFTQLNEIYIRGNTVKYCRLPDEMLEKCKEESINAAQQAQQGGQQGGGGAPTRGRGQSQRGAGGHSVNYRGRGGGQHRGSSDGQRGGHRGSSQRGGGQQRGGYAPRGGQAQQRDATGSHA